MGAISFLEVPMRFFVICLIPLFVLNCNPNPKFPPWVIFPANESKIKIQITYGSSKGDLYKIDDLYPQIIQSTNEVCFHSRHPNAIDYGAKLSICLPTNHLRKDQFNAYYMEFNNAIQALVHQGRAQSYPKINYEWEDSKIHFDFITEISLRNQWRSSQPINFIIGDLRLKKIFSLSHDIQWMGEKKFLSRYYSIPYWNFEERNDICAFYFSPWDIQHPANQRRLLRIQLDCRMAKQAIHKFWMDLQSIHELAMKDCTYKPLALSEAFSHTESDFNRYLEFTNPSQFPNCNKKFFIQKSHLRSLDLLDEKDGVEFLTDWDFLFPGATVLFAPKDSKLEAYVWEENYNWSQLGSGSIGIYSNGEEVSINHWNRSSGFRFEDEFVSWRDQYYPCSLPDNPYISKEAFCGSPGTRDFLALDEEPFCQIEDIHLTEINFWGMDIGEGSLDTRDRFIEFLYHNDNKDFSCDPSSLWLDIENQRFPIFIPSIASKNSSKNTTDQNSYLIYPSEVFLISLSTRIPFLENKVFPRNLFQLHPRRKIDIIQWNPKTLQNKRKTIYNPNNIFYDTANFTIIPRDEEGRLHSLVFPDWENRWDRTIMVHHPPTPYLNLKNHMSPGTLNPPAFWIHPEILESPDNNSYHTPRIQISEVLWPGSYHNRTSILSDRFLEWRNLSHTIGSFYLTIEYPNFPNRNQAYFIPLSNKEYSFISSTKLACFQNQKGIHSNSFRLFNENGLFRIYSESGLLEDEFYLDTNQYGENNTQERIRKSAAYSFSSHQWSTSEPNEDSDCEQETFASPGKANLTEVGP